MCSQALPRRWRPRCAHTLAQRMACTNAYRPEVIIMSVDHSSSAKPVSLAIYAKKKTRKYTDRNVAYVIAFIHTCLRTVVVPSRHRYTFAGIIETQSPSAAPTTFQPNGSKRQTSYGFLVNLTDVVNASSTWPMLHTISHVSYSQSNIIIRLEGTKSVVCAQRRCATLYLISNVSTKDSTAHNDHPPPLVTKSLARAKCENKAFNVVTAKPFLAPAGPGQKENENAVCVFRTASDKRNRPVETALIFSHMSQTQEQRTEHCISEAAFGKHKTQTHTLHQNCTRNMMHDVCIPGSRAKWCAVPNCIAQLLAASWAGFCRWVG